MEIQVPDKLLPVFHNLSTNQYDAIVLEGGRGGAKSDTLATVAIMESYIDDGVILCCREIQKSINDSLYSAIKAEIEKRGLEHVFKILSNEITNTATGARFIFAGLKNNVTNIKSIKKLRVVITDEAENVSQMSWDVLRPTPRYGNVRQYVAFNPRFEADATWQEFVVKKDARTLHIKINWSDNPWFPESLNNQRLRDMAGDLGRYQWIWEGKFLKISDASIFGNKCRIEAFADDLYLSADRLFYGADFGFANDPSTLIRSFILNNKLYIEYEAYGTGVELDEMAEFYDSLPESRKWTIKGDCSRPETISYLRRQGFNIEAAAKWQGCVEDGIQHIRGFEEIVIHERCTHTAEEAVFYKYKEDPNTGEILPIIVDKHNHCWDAIRYSLDGYIQARGGMGIWAQLAK